MDIADIRLTNRNIRTVLDQALADHAHRIVLRDASSEYSYAQAWSAALDIGGGLEALGVGFQHPVLFMLDDHADNILCWLATALTGRIEASINTAYKGEMLAHVINDAAAATIILDEAYLQTLIDIAQEVSELKTIVLRRRQHSEPQASQMIPYAIPEKWSVIEFSALFDGGSAKPAQLSPWDLISISYTSGTTGRSKGVLCPHAHAFGHATGEGLGITRPDETRFVVLPQFHTAGRCGGVYNTIVQGGCAHIAGRFRASTYWADALAAKAKTSQLLGAMAEFLIRQPPRDIDRHHGLREIAIMPLPLNHHDWMSRFNVATSTGYGSTEIGSILVTTHTESRSVGRVRDENDVEVPDNTAGELVARPALAWTSCIGYHNQPEQTALAWRNGWFHSGDALYRDENGNFYFVDRVDDALRRRGENISSAEVEFFIEGHPDVRACAVVGVPSDVQEDEIKAVVVLEKVGSITQLNLVRDLAKKMPYFMVPRYVEFVDELPRTPTAKVQKNLLRANGVKDAWDSVAAGFNPKNGL
jgi:crotonobetaine/carnitine-CoA ligase